MKIKQIKSKFLRGEFDQNTYVILGDKTAVIIDAGAELKDIKKVARGKRVLAVLMTHLHFDHLWNIEDILNVFDCDMYIAKGAEHKLDSGRGNVSVIIGEEMHFKVDYSKIKTYEPRLTLGEFEFEIIPAPGHSKDSVLIKFNDNLFSGDTVFDGAIGRTDLDDGNMGDMQESLAKILNIKFDTIYPGHFNVANKKSIENTIKKYL